MKPSADIGAIQVMRGIAALAVAIGHAGMAFTPDLVPGLWATLAFGVDVFFVISGFIMVHTASPYVEGRHTPGDFYARRWIRIWPLYAICTAVFVASRILYSREVLPPDIPPGALAASLLFLPSVISTGELMPVLRAGWTLNYEMMFYAIFAVILWVAPRRLVLGIALAIAVAVIAGQLLGDANLATRFLANPISLEFVFGCALARAYAAGHLGKNLSVVLMALGLISFVLVSTAASDREDNLRALRWGLPALAIVAGALAVRTNPFPRLTGALVALGGASYSLYLVHLVVHYNLQKVAFKLLPVWSHGPVGGPLLAVVATIASMIAAFLLYDWIERPLTKRLNDRYRQWRAGDAAARRSETLPAAGEERG